MVLAEREWSDSNVGRAEQLLDECVPKPGSTDLRGWEWHYLKRQCHTDLKTIHGPPTQAMGVAFSPDDRHSPRQAMTDKAVRIWNAQTGELEKTLLGPTAVMSEGVAYSPDGTLLAASSGDYFKPGGVIIWDAATGKQLWNSPTCAGFLPTSPSVLTANASPRSVANGTRVQCSRSGTRKRATKLCREDRRQG